ncbi:MAG: TIGR02453 family protein [Pseudomonadota bacterium]
MQAFDSFSPEALDFLGNLRRNNTKDWFAANRASYDAHLKRPSGHFAIAISQALRDLTGYDHGSKIFRIHRDVRFSKDKTPYNAHLHLAFMPHAQDGQPPMWFFGLSPEKVSLGCGVFQYEKAALTAFRTAMDGPKGVELGQLTTELRGAEIRIGEPDLKRVPAGFDKHHPNGEALRRKGFAAWVDHDDPTFATEPNLVKRTTEQFDRLMPVFQLLSRIR